MNMKDKIYLDVHDVMSIMGVKQCKAYSVIRDLNKELIEKGFFTVQGKIPKRYFFERIGGKGAGI